jgi:glutathione S-transferase
MIKIHGVKQSRASRCMWLLEELGTPYVLEPVNIATGDNRKPEYLALNPSGKVPLLSDGDFTMSESHAINLWLAQRDGGKFWPSAAETLGRVLQWTAWTGSELEPVTNGILRGKRAGKEEQVKEFQAAAHDLVRLVELRLEKSAFLAGPEFSLADLSVGSSLAFSEFFGVSLAPFPKVTAWLAQLKARPAYQRVFAG